MELNYDCVRRILMICEREMTTKTTYNDHLEISVMPATALSEMDEMKDHLHKLADIQYTIKKMHEAGLVEAYDRGGCNYQITDITFKGHELLRTITLDSTWAKIKTKAVSTMGALSLNVIMQCAEHITSQTLSEMGTRRP